MRTSLLLACCLPALWGCVMVDVGVTNPIVGLTTVAVVPFYNLSQERTVDGQRFAMAYFTELQKTPGFQVIPVGVVEQVIFDNRLQMSDPDDVLQLAQLLNADAVVVGAVTDYSPYYPPRIGMQVSWYSPRPWNFYPGIPTDEFAREMEKPSLWSRLKHKNASPDDCPPETIILSSPTANASEVTPRGQSPDWTDNSIPVASPVSLPEFLLFGESGARPQVTRVADVAPGNTPRELELPNLPPPPGQNDFERSGIPQYDPPVITGQLPLPRSEPQFDPRQPLMSYTRMFDGADPKLTARLRDYTELSGDLRAGGWQSYLYRSEDFIRFSSHVMIVEMLQLHGGEARKRVVFKLRKNR